MGMEVGLSMDLVTGWNFDKAEDKELSERYIQEYRPTFLIGSPMCTMFSQLQAMNQNKDPERFQERLRKAESAESPGQVLLHRTTPICGLPDLAQTLILRGETPAK